MCVDKNILILLPQKISILRNKKNQDIAIDREEYNIYYQNIIYPYSDNYDIQIECKYGKNLGHCWRLSDFSDDMSTFDFTLNIYGDYGKLLASKTSVIEIVEKKACEEIKLLCIGDSMTRSEIYIQQAVDKARNIKTVGLRNIAYNVNHEGRGGWSSYIYLERSYEDEANGKYGVSPFLFPTGYSAKEYFGNKRFWDKINSGEYSAGYTYAGIKPQQIFNGMICCDDGILYRYKNGEYVEENKSPEFEFSFGKYIERYDIEKPDIVSILFGSNELQTCKYADAVREIEKFVSTLQKMVESIKQYSDDTKIIINLPVRGADQYSWGNQMGCVSSLKQYNYCIMKAAEALLNTFDGRAGENIFVCPMIAVCDPVAAFPSGNMKMNIYSEITEVKHTNWVHPSGVGYRQMGDALAATIMSIR